MDDKAIADLAAGQHGLVTFEQARQHGFTPQALRHRIESGRWERIQLGVFRIRGTAETYEQLLLAACLAIGPVAAASHRAAAVLHGLLTFSAPPVEVTTTRDHSPELAGSVVVHRLADLLPRWIEDVSSVPCTTVSRTLVDLGAVCAPSTVEAALDRAVGRRVVTVGEADAVLRAVARKGRRGVGAMRKALAARDGDPAAGVFEARMSTLLRGAGIPAPMAEYQVHDRRGHVVARVDFAYPDLRLALEVDGYGPHVALDAFKNDRVRQNRLIALGWTVLRFTWAEVDGRSPSVPMEVADALRRLRAENRHFLAR